MLAALEDSYQKEIIKNSRGEDNEREVLKLPPLLSPHFATIIPLPVGKEKGQKEIRTQAYQLYCELLKSSNFSVTYEETDNIGKSYRRQDAIGTYYCLTLDTQTVQDNTITLRQRDNMKQTRMSLEEVKNYLNSLYEKH
jgi:glycyl-tRNA synthetase